MRWWHSPALGIVGQASWLIDAPAFDGLFLVQTLAELVNIK